MKTTAPVIPWRRVRDLKTGVFDNDARKFSNRISRYMSREFKRFLKLGYRSEDFREMYEDVVELAIISATMDVQGYLKSDEDDPPTAGEGESE